MKVEIIFDNEFKNMIAATLKQIFTQVPTAPAKTQDSVLSPLANLHAGQQSVQATTPQAPIQQPTTPNPVPVKMPENISNSDAVNQFINGQTPTAPPIQPTTPQTVTPTVPTQQVPPAPPTQAPTTAPSYDVQKLAVAAMQLKDAGRIGEIQELIAKYGVATIMQLKPEQYDAFAQDLIAKGVKF
jgi:hypothetical protein